MACSTLYLVHTNNIVLDVSIFLQVLLLSHSLVIALVLVCPGEHLCYVTNYNLSTVISWKSAHTIYKYQSFMFHEGASLGGALYMSGKEVEGGGGAFILIVSTCTTKECPCHACLGGLDPPSKKIIGQMITYNQTTRGLEFRQNSLNNTMSPCAWCSWLVHTTMATSIYAKMLRRSITSNLYHLRLCFSEST